MILLNLILFIVVLGLLWWLISLLPLPVPFPRIVQVLFVAIAIAGVLSALFGFSIGGFTVPRLV